MTTTFQIEVKRISELPFRFGQHAGHAEGKSATGAAASHIVMIVVVAGGNVCAADRVVLLRSEFSLTLIPSRLETGKGNAIEQRKS